MKMVPTSTEHKRVTEQWCIGPHFVAYVSGSKARGRWRYEIKKKGFGLSKLTVGN